VFAPLGRFEYSKRLLRIERSRLKAGLRTPASQTSSETVDNPSTDRNSHSMSSLAMEIDLALQRLDPSNAARLERLLRDGLALALGVEVAEKATPEPAAAVRRELFSRRFAPLAAVPDRDLSDIVSENRGEA
jgi:hypothetical protein